MALADRQSPGNSSDLSSEELEDAGEACTRGTTRAASSPRLSSHSSKGGSITRVKKRKARDAGRRPHVLGEAMPPIRRLTADSESDFRDIVHRFTGNPSVPPPSPKLPFLAADSQRSFHQDNTMMFSEVNNSKSFALLKALLPSHLHGSDSCSSEMATNNPAFSPSMCNGGGGDLGHLFVSQLHNIPNHILNMNMVGSQGLPPTHMLGMQHSHQSQQAAQLESFLLEGNDH